MNNDVPLESLRDSIPSSDSDLLLREWGFDLVTEYARVVGEARLDRASPVVELATGTGRMVAVLTRLGYSVVSGDLTLERYQDALNRLTPAFRPQALFTLLNMERLPFPDDSVHAIVCMNTIHELANPVACLMELVRVHNPQGTLVIGDFNETGFDAMQRLHQTVYRNDHSRGKLPMRQVQSFLEESYANVREVVTPLNISYIVTQRKKSFGAA